MSAGLDAMDRAQYADEMAYLDAQFENSTRPALVAPLVHAETVADFEVGFSRLTHDDDGESDEVVTAEPDYVVEEGDEEEEEEESKTPIQFPASSYESPARRRSAHIDIPGAPLRVAQARRMADLYSHSME
jgi:hypothetical protein